MGPTVCQCVHAYERMERLDYCVWLVFRVEQLMTRNAVQHRGNNVRTTSMEYKHSVIQIQ